jgi:hypothetical protein
MKIIIAIIVGVVVYSSINTCVSFVKDAQITVSKSYRSQYNDRNSY